MAPSLTEAALTWLPSTVDVLEEGNQLDVESASLEPLQDSGVWPGTHAALPFLEPDHFLGRSGSKPLASSACRTTSPTGVNPLPLRVGAPRARARAGAREDGSYGSYGSIGVLTDVTGLVSWMSLVGVADVTGGVTLASWAGSDVDVMTPGVTM